MPDDGVIMPLETVPGGVNYYRAGTNDRIMPIFNDSRVDFGLEILNERRQRIRESFYIDQLQLRNNGPQMTATEVVQRTEERSRLLAPILSRQQNEFLRVIIDRVFAILNRRGMLPEAPEILKGKVVDVKYTSAIAKSQTAGQVQAVYRTMEGIAPFASFDPSVVDNFDSDKACRFIAKATGFPQEIIRNEDEVIKMRESRAEAQQAAAQTAQDTATAEQISKVAPALADLNKVSQSG
jgi:hypothetical protein